MTPGQESALRALIRNPDAAIFGQGIDMRCGRGLIERGYWTPGEAVHISGYHALGMFKHLPVIPRVPREVFASYECAHVQLTENHILQPIAMSGEDPDPPMDWGSKTFAFSCTKILKTYDGWARSANWHIAPGWSREWDYDFERGAKGDGHVWHIKNRAWDRASEAEDDVRYTFDIVREIAEELCRKATTGEFRSTILGSTSNKYSFGDTDDEAERFQKDDSETACLGKFTIEVGH